MQIIRVTYHRDNGGKKITRIRRRTLLDTNNRKGIIERIEEALDLLDRSQDRFGRALKRICDYIT